MTRRRLGLPTATALVVANMIGAGVFTTSGYSLAALGSRGAVLWAWVIGGVLATCGALAYAALARRYPESGGEYEFLRRTMHPFAGFLAGWVSLIAGFTAPIAVAAEAFGRYAGTSFGIDVDPLWTGTVAIVVSGVLHGVHVDPGARVQNAMVVVKIAMIAGLVAIGAVVILGRAVPVADGEFSGDAPAFVGAFASTMMWIWFAYSGWNAAVYVGGEVRDAEHNLPRALIGGTLLVTAMYLALNWVFVASAPVTTLAGQAEIGAVAADAIGGKPLRIAVGGLVSLALLTSITSMVMAGPRVYARMAADGVFPRMFREGDGPPRAAIALQCALALVILWSSDLVEKLTYVGWTLGVSTAATVIGLFLLRSREGAAAVPIRGGPVAPAVYVVFVLGTAALAFRDAWTRDSLAPIYAVATLASGALVYPLVRRAGASG